MTTTETEIVRGGPTPPRTNRGRNRMRRGEAVAGYLFTAPQVLGFLAFVIGPMVAVVWYSLNDYQVLTNTVEFVGLENWTRISEDERLPQVLAATVIFVVLLVPAGIVLGLTLAVLVTQKLPGITIFRGIYFMPTLVSIAAWTIVWQFMLLPDGLINSALRTLSIDGPLWLRETPTAIAAVVVVQLIKGAGINMLIFVAALQGVSQDVIEAARLDGAGRWTIIRRITIPMISPEILMVSILMTLAAFKTFQQILLLTGGGPGYSTSVLAYYVYQRAFEANDFGYASALALVLFAILLLLTLFVWQLRKRLVFYESE